MHGRYEWIVDWEGMREYVQEELSEMYVNAHKDSGREQEQGREQACETNHPH